MTGQRQSDHEITEFLRDRAGPLSDQLLESVDAQVRRTPQVRGSSSRLPTTPWQLPRWQLAAAAAVIVAIVAVALDRTLPNGLQGIIGPGSGASDRPSRTEGPSGGPRPPEGRWSTTDVDGSPMTLDVAPAGEAWAATYSDLRSTTCAGKPFVANGSGAWDGASLTVEGTGRCDGADAVQAFAATYELETASGVLVQRDQPGITGPVDFVWRRGSAPIDAFDGTWSAGARRLVLDTSGLAGMAHMTESGAAACAGGDYDAGGPAMIGSTTGEGRFVTITLAGGCPDQEGDVSVKFEYVFASNSLRGPLTLDGEPTSATLTWTR
jgi:hypothetical protein